MTSGSGDTLQKLTLIGDIEQLQAASAALFDAGAGGLVEGPGEVSVYAQNEAELVLFRAVAARFGELSVKVETIDSDWQNTWQSALGPERVSSSFTLRPTHCDKGAGDESDKETIWFEPHASFGSGGHATTRLAASWVEEQFRKNPGLDCFDVGTGTGVLALVALRSGAKSVLAVDIDQVAIDSARRNAELNSVSTGLQIELGSADFCSEHFPVVLANINTHILRDLAGDLAARVAPGGILMLTGLLQEDTRDLVQLFEGFGLALGDEKREGEWALLALNRATEPPSY